MSYQVKEIYYTLQGEGARTGRAAVFLRFSGCNLWSGHEKDRARAVCRFCDTDFVGTDGTNGGRYASANALAEAIEREWPAGEGARRFAVLTGGEPALQVDAEFVAALHARDFLVAIETNGTLELPVGIDWVCVSPQADASPSAFEGLAFEHFLLQPMDGPDARANTERAVAYCMRHPRWRLSLQTHKFLGIR